MNILETVYFNNALKLWLISSGIGICLFIILKLVIVFGKHQLEKIAPKTVSRIDDVVLTILNKTISLTIIIISIYIASLALNLSEYDSKIILNTLILVTLLQIALWGNALISFYITEYTNKKKETDAAAVTTVSSLSFIAKLILYTGLLLIALDNLGFNVTTLVAGLGVGGIAIALAVQNILSDLFASLSIVLDKPFVVGDFIIINEYLGTVEHIGLKTTRIRSLSGEQLIFANNDLLNSRIRNFKRMYERRVVSTIGVVYQTSEEQLRKIPTFIKDIIKQQDQVRFDRSHFKGFGNYSLDFETVYWIKLADYNTYMDIQQAINLDIFQKFKKENIEFAYPTQKIYVDK